MAERALVYSPDMKRENRLPPKQALTDKFPVLQFDDIHELDIASWTFSIFGLVVEERILTFDEFCALPRVTIYSDIHCVTGWSRLDNRWDGVSTTVIQNLVEIESGARFVTVYGAGGFTTNLRRDDFFAEDVLFALEHDGQPITPGHGYPIRLVVPRLYFWKSAKWVTGVEFTGDEKLGYWETHGYHRRGDPWQEERYSFR